MLEITHHRINHLVDPHLEIWEWPVAADLFLGGLVAGLMILHAVWRLTGREDESHACVRTGPMWAPVLLSLAMFFLWTDLAYKVHFYRFYLTFQVTSAMSWGSWILLFVFAALFLAVAIARGMDDFKGKLAILNFPLAFLQALTFGREKLVMWLNAILGICLALYTGMLLASFGARPLWNTALLAPMFLVTGLATASAWNLLSKPTETERTVLNRWLIWFIVVDIIFIGLYTVILLTSSQGTREAVYLFMGGPFTAFFWIFVVIIGLMLPLWLLLRAISGRYAPDWAAPVFVLIGGLALRLFLVHAGQVSHLPEIEMLSGGIGH